MPEKTVQEIENRNQKYLEEIQGNLGKYLSYLSTMARFHKYEVADLTNFALEAPAMFTAVASKELWEKHFRRKISATAKGVTLIKDGKKLFITTFRKHYDVSETEFLIENEIKVKLWAYDDSAHKKFIDAIVADEQDTEKQIRKISQELTNRRNLNEKIKKLVSFSAEAVILERMGYSPENATRQLARLSFKDQDISLILTETQATARIFLDAMQKAVVQLEVENVNDAENNPLLKEIGVIQVEDEITKTPKPTETLIQPGLFDDYAEESETLQDNKENEQVKIFDSDEKSLEAAESAENLENPSTGDTVQLNEFQNIEENEAAKEIIDTPHKDADYDFEEDENFSKIESNQQSEEEIETVPTDLTTLIAEDMAIIRGNSRDKNIFRKNVTAIRTLKNIESEKRTATPEELEILKGYVGFGGIPKAFDKDDENWNREAWLLQSILTEKEYSDARASTLNAHYTPGEIIQKIYEGLKKTGL